MAIAFIEDRQIKFAKPGDPALVGKLFVWKIVQSRAKNIQALIEIYNAGATKESVDEIIVRWNITDDDLVKFSALVKLKLECDVGVWFAMKKNRKERMIVGSAITAFYACADLWLKIKTTEHD